MKNILLNTVDKIIADFMLVTSIILTINVIVYDLNIRSLYCSLDN